MPLLYPRQQEASPQEGLAEPRGRPRLRRVQPLLQPERAGRRAARVRLPALLVRMGAGRRLATALFSFHLGSLGPREGRVVPKGRLGIRGKGEAGSSLEEACLCGVPGNAFRLREVAKLLDVSTSREVPYTKVNKKDWPTTNSVGRREAAFARGLMCCSSKRPIAGPAAQEENTKEEKMKCDQHGTRTRNPCQSR
ncbi:hypothetical protein GGR56DRAFT_177095 [Xylariaceae sp. FL0804]|nr:hypothetical protein GGR56DRAFT_177095 [Xylariaceae sp. FL0804]